MEKFLDFQIKLSKYKDRVKIIPDKNYIFLSNIVIKNEINIDKQVAEMSSCQSLIGYLTALLYSISSLNINLHIQFMRKYQFLSNLHTSQLSRMIEIEFN